MPASTLASSSSSTTLVMVGMSSSVASSSGSHTSSTSSEFGPDHALDLVGDRGGVAGEESGVEALRPPRRGDGAGDEVDVAEVGVDIGLGEFGPDLAGRGRRLVALHAEQQAGFLGHFAHRRQRHAAREFGAWSRRPVPAVCACVPGCSSLTADMARSSASMRPPGNTNLPGMNLWPWWRRPSSTFGRSVARSISMIVAASRGSLSGNVCSRSMFVMRALRRAPRSVLIVSSVAAGGDVPVCCLSAAARRAGVAVRR